MQEQTLLEGGCLCGAIRYRVTGAPVMASICHCNTCRRAGAASSLAWAMFRREQLDYTTSEPATYTSAARGQRGYCPSCGTPISLTASWLPGLIDITIGSLDDPDAIKASRHYWGTRRLPWLRYAYSAPKREAREALVESDDV